MLVFLLFSFVVLTAVCGYIAWFNPNADRYSAGRAQGGFYLSLGFVVVCLIFLAIVNSANDRLIAAGITPHPHMVGPIGPAAGQGTNGHIWVYETAVPGEMLIDFYRNPEHVTGWRQTKSDNSLLEFKNETHSMSISGGSRKTLVIMIKPLKNEQ